MNQTTKKSIISENDIMMYLALAMKHLRLMVLLICLSLTLGLVYYSYARPVYFSQALIRHEVLQRPVDAEKVFHEKRRLLVAQFSKRGPVVQRAARKMGADVSTGDIYRQYIRKVAARFDAEQNLIIEVWPYSYEWARDFPEVLFQEYLLYQDERRLARMETFVKTLSREVDEMKQRIDNVFDARFNFRETNQMVRLAIDLNEYKSVPADILVLKQELALMDQVREALSIRNTVARLSLLAALERDLEELELISHRQIPQVNIGQIIPDDQPATGLVVVPSLINSPLKKSWEDLDKEKRRLENLSQDMGQKFLPGHPKMIAILQPLETVNGQLELELESQMSRFDLDYSNRLDRLHALEAKLPEYQKVTREFSKQKQEADLVDARQLPWKQWYARMNQQLEAMDFGADKDRDQLTYLGLLDIKDTPVSPPRLKLLVYFLLLGLALAIGVPFLIEYIDSRVSDVEQVEETLRIRSLGVVPKITEVSVDSLLFADQSEDKMDHHITENFRLIRTNLIMNSATPTLPQVILVTSAMPQEGKTVVAANLALSFARKGETTLLVDADLRRGRLHRLFNCPGRPGLSEILAEGRPLEDGLRIVNGNGNGHANGNGNGNGHENGHANGNGNGHGHLSLMTCGKHLHWASELLDSPAFPKLIDDLRQRYQRIIIDTPPVLGLSETAIIQRIADGVLLVIWSEYTLMRNVKTAIQTLQTNGAKFSGFVLNRLDFSALTNRYRYFYYSPYYYYSYRPVESPAIPPPGQ